MKISCVKSKKDNDSFKFLKVMGVNVQELDDLDETDKTLNELILQEYHTIIISNEVAGFSTDIVKKYQKNKNVSIIIAPSRRIGERGSAYKW